MELHNIGKKRVLLFFAILSAMSLLAANQYADAAMKPERQEVTPSQTNNVEIDGAKGKLSAVVYRLALQNGEKSTLVILMHGFMADKQDPIVTAIASGLQEKGMAYIRFDFNGHGDSEGDFENMTVANEIEDAKKIYEYARSLDFVGDIALLGHSQGGVVASMVAGELGAENISGLVLMAPAAVLKDNALNGEMFGVRFNPVNIPEYVPVFNRRVGREYTKVAQTLPIYETAARYVGPVFIIHGMSDEIVPYSYGERYKDGYKDATIHLVEGGDHNFTHELDEVKNMAVDFLAGLNKK